MLFAAGAIGTGLAVEWLFILAADWMAENFK